MTSAVMKRVVRRETHSPRTIATVVLLVLVALAAIYVGESIPDIADRLRDEIGTRLLTHTALNVTGIDITVRDIQQLSSPGEET